MIRSVSLLIFIPCLLAAKLLDGVFAVFDDSPILYSEVQSEYSNMVKKQKAFGGQATLNLAVAMSNLIKRTLVKNVGSEDSLTPTRDEILQALRETMNLDEERTKELKTFLKTYNIPYEDFIEDKSVEIIKQRILSRYIAPRAEKFTEQELKTYYLKNKNTFKMPRRYTYQKIIKRVARDASYREKKKARDTLSLIKKKVGKSAKKFTAAVRASSDITNQGGILLAIPQKALAQAAPLELKTLKKLKPGAVGGPVEGYDFFALVRLIKVDPPGTRSFTEARDAISRFLTAQWAEKAFGKWSRDEIEKRGLLIHPLGERILGKQK